MLRCDQLLQFTHDVGPQEMFNVVRVSIHVAGLDIRVFD